MCIVDSPSPSNLCFVIRVIFHVRLHVYILGVVVLHKRNFFFFFSFFGSNYSVVVFHIQGQFVVVQKVVV